MLRFVVHVVSYSMPTNHGVCLSDRQWEFDPIKDIMILNFCCFVGHFLLTMVRSKISTEIHDKTEVCHDPRAIICSKRIFSLIPLNNMKKKEC